MKTVPLDVAIELVGFWIPGGPQFDPIKEQLVEQLRCASARSRLMNVTLPKRCGDCEFISIEPAHVSQPVVCYACCHPGGYQGGIEFNEAPPSTCPLREKP